MTGSVRRVLGFLAICCVAAVSTGCGAGARISVLRPAMLNAREFGGSMSVAPFEGPPMAAAAIQQDLRQRIMTAEGNPVALVDGNAGLLIHGAVVAFNYDERVDEASATCTRTARNSDGSTRTVSYPCTRYTRIGTAMVAISFNITATATGQVIFTNTYSGDDTARQSESGSMPANINSARLLERIRARLTAQFAQVILPWRETVTVTLGRCGDARSICEGGIGAIRAGDFPAAIQNFQQAIQTLEAMPETNQGDLAEAYWNLGLAREYSSDFTGAVEAIMRAIELDPESPAYRQELENVQQMAEDAARLSEQGVTEP